MEEAIIEAAKIIGRAIIIAAIIRAIFNMGRELASWGDVGE